MTTARRAPRAHRCPPERRGTTRLEARTARLNGPIIGCLAVALGTAAPCDGAGAQGRELKRYGPGAPEAKLMLYYSSIVAFSPLGAPAATLSTATTSSRVEAAVELSYLPRLSTAQRTTGYDKPESTNLAPVFARPRIGVRLPGGLGVEMSWIPPIRVFDVKANLVGGALTRSFGSAAGVRIVPRLSFLTGRVEGPITCNRETANTANVALATYFAFVCHGRESRDFFEPRHLSGELLVARGFARGRLEPYLSAGARGERTRFDVGVIRPDGGRDPDNPLLQVNATRAYGTAGASWLGARHTRLAAELYYAPGSAVTVRALAGFRAW
jgi:hypothetical protein